MDTTLSALRVFTYVGLFVLTEAVASRRVYIGLVRYLLTGLAGVLVTFYMLPLLSLLFYYNVTPPDKKLKPTVESLHSLLTYSDLIHSFMITLVLWRVWRVVDKYDKAMLNIEALQNQASNNSKQSMKWFDDLKQKEKEAAELDEEGVEEVTEATPEEMAELQDSYNQLRQAMEEREKELERKDKDLSATKAQAENTSKEYLRLMTEHEQLQHSVDKEQKKGK